ncbi:MAG: hypothetical protein R8G60_02025 [Roseovarius pacificus]|nr:hypothetical protein [Roseovarius pacificus]
MHLKKAVLFLFLTAASANAENSYTPMRDCDTTMWLINEVIRVNSNFSLAEWEAIDAQIIERHPDTTPLVALRSKNTVDGIISDLKEKNLSVEELKAHLRSEWHC